MKMRSRVLSLYKKASYLHEGPIGFVRGDSGSWQGSRSKHVRLLRLYPRCDLLYLGGMGRRRWWRSISHRLARGWSGGLAPFFLLFSQFFMLISLAISKPLTPSESHDIVIFLDRDSNLRPFYKSL